eukprot:5675324-Lingulodinium_polyedra.AAC.1
MTTSKNHDYRRMENQYSVSLLFPRFPRFDHRVVEELAVVVQCGRATSMKMNSEDYSELVRIRLRNGRPPDRD